MLKKYYYLPFADACCWRLSSASPATDFLAEHLARICRMCMVPPAGMLQILNCVICGFEQLDLFRAEHPELRECGRKHYFRVFFDADSVNSWMFFNMEEINNDTMNILSAANIAKVLQLQMINRGNYAPCHCALVEINGKGAIICASGDIGKSTSARRIAGAGHRVLADDYALLIEHGGRITAQSMPTWSRLTDSNPDYTADCSRSSTLSAVFFLKQSKADYVETLSKYFAAKRLNAALQDLCGERTVTDMPRKMLRKLRTGIFDFAHRVLERLPAYSLHATLHGESWREMDKVMTGGKR